VFPPREITESCLIFRDIYDQDNLEDFFQSRDSDLDLNKKLCLEKTKV
jgi:hypothetical protein